jgi:mercuric ion transport protein
MSGHRTTARVFSGSSSSWLSHLRSQSPVVFTAFGSGASAAGSTRLAPARPLFLALTAVLLGAGFFQTYRTPRTGVACSTGTCAPGINRKARVLLWTAAIAVVLLAGFPYYAEYLF